MRKRSLNYYQKRIPKRISTIRALYDYFITCNWMRVHLDYDDYLDESMSDMQQVEANMQMMLLIGTLLFASDRAAPRNPALPPDGLALVRLEASEHLGVIASERGQPPCGLALWGLESCLF